jgi:hypothetical protein
MNQRRWGVGATLAAAALLAWVGGRRPVERLAQRLDRDQVPAAAFGSQRLRAALHRDGFLYLQPDREPGTASGEGCPEPPIGTRPVAPADMPSSRLPAEFAARGAVVSLALAPCRLERLLSHPLEHGRDWEETGWVSFFENGELRFASAVGVRLHGGNDRAGKRSRRGYRLYFRDVYGAPGFPGPLLAADLEQPVGRLILRYDRARDHAGRRWFFVQPLAFDLARRLGGETPRTRPAWLLVNGRSEQLVTLTEHISPDLLARRFGHAEFDLLRAKGEREPDEERLWREELAWLAGEPRPLRAERVAARYDLADLTAWMVVNAFCATGDTFQPTLARDRRGAVRGGRWFPIHWDMDASFFTVSRRERWRRLQDPLRLVLDPEDHPRLLVGRLLHRLLTEDPDYRRMFERRVEEALAGELDSEFLADRLAAYEREAAALGLPERAFFDEWRAFLAGRPAALREEATRLLAAP